MQKSEIGTCNSGGVKNRNRQFCYGEGFRPLFIFNNPHGNNKILIFGPGEAKIEIQRAMQKPGENAPEAITAE